MTPTKNVDNNSLVVATAPINTGVGRYAQLLFELGLMKSIALYKKSPKSSVSGYPRVVEPLHGGHTLNALISPFVQTEWAKDVTNFEKVHVTTPDFFHLVKYNENLVGTVHDLFTLESALTKKAYSLQYRKFIDWNLSFLDRLKGVIAISHVTKRQLAQHFPGLKVDVIHHWENNNFKFRDKKSSRIKLGLPEGKKLLLHVSSAEPRKNLDHVSKILQRLGPDYVLVRIGDYSPLLDKIDRRRVMCFSNVDDDFYPLFFNSCDVFLSASLTEGFNRPILQAVKSNLPVVASDIEIHRELLKGGEHLLDLDDVRIWCDTIREICSMDIEESRDGDYLSLSDYYSESRALKETSAFYAKSFA